MSDTFSESLVYHFVLFLYLLICVAISTMNYKGPIVMHIVLAIISPYILLVFAPMLQGIAEEKDFVAIAIAANICNLIAVYYVYRTYHNRHD